MGEVTSSSCEPQRPLVGLPVRWQEQSVGGPMPFCLLGMETLGYSPHLRARGVGGTWLILT